VVPGCQRLRAAAPGSAGRVGITDVDVVIVTSSRLLNDPG
jgi:hypothetical protein